MRLFPLFLDLRGRRVLVVGEGPRAAHKAEALMACGAEVCRRPRFAPADLEEAVLAVAADAPEADLVALARAARARGIPLNVVDRPDLSSFYWPAVVDRAPLSVAIGTAGTAPLLARTLRSLLEARLPARLGALALALERARARLRPLRDPAARRRLLEGLLRGRFAELILAGREEEAEAAFEAALAAQPEGGIVYLVGAGPGEAELLTLRAQYLLSSADAIVYDRLVAPEILARARQDAERYYVGKARGAHCLPQQDINALLIRLARAGKRVVRLKGGDPLVFARGGEELAALHAAGVPAVVVPGVTAALACAASFAIPLTHRDHARTLAFLTGHTREGRVDLDFAALARLPSATLAIYMGRVTLATITRGFLEAGLAPDIPSALIECGGSRRARALFSPLAALAEAAEEAPPQGPALLLIGPAVGEAPGYRLPLPRWEGARNEAGAEEAPSSLFSLSET
jgi:uroporphyrin-III C-methyltransferase/precorrin-2 dehydrogenase/sirohydrochlorin ferrochelatase